MAKSKGDEFKKLGEDIQRADARLASFIQNFNAYKDANNNNNVAKSSEYFNKLIKNADLFETSIKKSTASLVKLKKTTQDTKQLQELAKALANLTSAGTKWGQVLRSINDGMNVNTQAFEQRLSSAVRYYGMGSNALARLKNVQSQELRGLSPDAAYLKHQTSLMWERFGNENIDQKTKHKRDEARIRGAFMTAALDEKERKQNEALQDEKLKREEAFQRKLRKLESDYENSKKQTQSQKFAEDIDALNRALEAKRKLYEEYHKKYLEYQKAVTGSGREGRRQENEANFNMNQASKELKAKFDSIDNGEKARYDKRIADEKALNEEIKREAEATEKFKNQIATKYRQAEEALDMQLLNQKSKNYDKDRELSQKGEDEKLRIATETQQKLNDIYSKLNGKNNLSQKEKDAANAQANKVLKEQAALSRIVDKQLTDEYNKRRQTSAANNVSITTEEDKAAQQKLAIDRAYLAARLSQFNEFAPKMVRKYKDLNNQFMVEQEVNRNEAISNINGLFAGLNPQSSTYASDKSEVLKRVSMELQNLRQNITLTNKQFEDLANARYQQEKLASDRILATRKHLKDATQVLRSAEDSASSKALAQNSTLAKKAAKERVEATRKAISEIRALYRNANSAEGLVVAKQDATRRLTDLRSQLSRITAEYNKQAVEIERANSKLNRTKEQTSRLFKSVQRLGAAFGVAFSVRGLAQFGKKLIEVRGEFELQQTALRAIVQNKALADEIWNKTMNAALQSPFTALQLTKYTKQLAAYRIESSKLFDTTKMLADVSAGLGVDMQRLILAYGQVKSANWLRASEIRQFTEAGVNILGELSERFTKLKGKLVSTADVMQMVQKRMVSFHDVEEIFKKLTSEGGTFYNMQYIQSQTLKGQVNKLHDAYDQMLNTIGSESQGTLNAVVAALNKIVINWRLWAVAIGSLGLGTITALVVRLSVALRGAAIAGIQAGEATNKLAFNIKKLTAALKANWLTAIIGACVALGSALIGLVKRQKEANRAIQDQAGAVIDSSIAMQDLKDQIEANNKTIQDSKSSTEDLNKAQDSNRVIMQKLKNEYPELASQMDIGTKAIIKMNGAIDTQIRKLNEQMTLTYSMQQKGIFSDDFLTNMKEAGQEMAAAQNQFSKMQQAIRQEMVKMKNGDVKSFNSKLYKVYYKIASIPINDTLEEKLRKYNEYNKEVISIEEKNARGRKFPVYHYASENIRKLGIDTDLFLSDFNINNAREQFVKDSMYTAVDAFVEGLKDTYKEEIGSDDYKKVLDYLKAHQKDIQQALKEGKTKFNESFIKSYDGYSKDQQHILNNELNKYLKTDNFDYFAHAEVKSDNNPTNPTDDGDKKNEVWRKRIQLMEEMRKKYLELKKSAYGYAKSDKEVRNSFEKSFAEIFKGTGIAMGDVDFSTVGGMSKAMALIKKKASGADKSIQDELAKKIDSYEAEIAVNVEVNIRDSFDKQMEDMFSNYELTMEVKGMSIDKNAMEELFPSSEYTTLGKLQDKMQEFLNARTKDGKFSEEDAKTYEKWAKKVEAEVMKMRKERVKEYSKYLEKEYSERAKLEIKHAQDVAFVTANFSDKNQRESILANINKNYQQDLNEMNWKSFKESDFYVEMMDDLSSLPSDYMKMMLEKIEEILKNPETLSPRALKEAINARNKILEAQMNLAPLRVMREQRVDIKEAKNHTGAKTFYGTRNRLNDEIKANQIQIASLEKEEQYWDGIVGQMKAYEDAMENVNAARQNMPSEYNGALSDINSTKELRDNKAEELAKAQAKLSTMNALSEEESNATRQERQALIDEINQTQTLLGLLDAFISANKSLESITSSQAGSDAAKYRSEGKNSNYASIQKESKTSTKTKIQSQNQELKKGTKAIDNYINALAKFNANISSIIESVHKAGDAWYDMYESFGHETNAMTDGWKEFGGTMVSVVTQSLDLIPKMVTAIVNAEMTIESASGIIGIIAMAVSLVFQAITAINKLEDSYKEKDIEDAQKRIDALKKAYERLEKQIDKTWSSVDYMQNYDEMMENLNNEIKEATIQLNAERAKKNTEQDKVDEYNDKIDAAKEKMEELRKQQIEVFGGIGEDNYRSSAEAFVSAWKDAFLETGDGLDALQDHFDEFLNDWFVKQATMRITQSMLKNTFEQIDKAVSSDSDGGVAVTARELESIREEFARQSPILAEALEDLAGVFGIDGEGKLSGLTECIQGMTEQQAEVLSAYWNDVRFSTSNIDNNVSRIVSILSNNGVDTNPQLQQLRTIAAHTATIASLMQAVSKSGHPDGGAGIKVFNN